MNLCNGRSKIIKLFEDKNIVPSNFPHNAKSEQIMESESESEPELEQISELRFKLNPKFEESIAERTKMRRRKYDEENKKEQVF